MIIFIMSNNCTMFVDQFNNLQYFTTQTLLFERLKKTNLYKLIIYPTSSFNLKTKLLAPMYSSLSEFQFNI